MNITPVFKYFGDIDIQNGGYFFNTSNARYGYVDAYRVTPCSDAGGPDNEFWVEALTVTLPDDAAGIKRVLDGSGWLPDDLPKAKAARLAMLTDACIAYGEYDVGTSEHVRIGKQEKCPSMWEASEPHKILRAGSSLRNYVRNVFIPAN